MENKKKKSMNFKLNHKKKNNNSQNRKKFQQKLNWIKNLKIMQNKLQNSLQMHQIRIINNKIKIVLLLKTRNKISN